MIKRPMLAAKVTEEQIATHLETTSLILSPKLDGIRGVVQDGQLLSRSLKPIRNKFVQELLGRQEFEGLDGELIAGSPRAKDVYRKSSSAFMSAAGEPNFTFFVFDYRTCPKFDYCLRLRSLTQRVYLLNSGSIQLLDSARVETLSEVLNYEESLLEQGYEGLILRHPDMPYKYNRSTVKEGGLLKLKRFQDSEAEILSVEQLFHNENPAKISELGLTKHSSHKANKRPGLTMGYLRVRDIHTDQEFNVGTGFSAEERKQFWIDWIPSIGKIIKYKYFAIGVKDLPRHPVYLGLRDTIDL